jgi:predicted XRE-type DNA-binding protein
MPTKKDIPINSLEKLSQYGVKQKEAADIFKISQATVSRRLRKIEDD